MWPSQRILEQELVAWIHTLALASCVALDWPLNFFLLSSFEK